MNADFVRRRVQQLCGARTRLVVLDAETSPVIDVTAAAMLVDLRDTLARRGVDFRIARSIGQFGDELEAAEPGTARIRVYPTVAAAPRPPRGAPDQER